MPPPYCYDHPRPAVTVDLAVFSLFGEELKVLLIRRKHDPFAGSWALPGGFIEMEEPIEDAARRELREETGLEASGPVALIGVFGAPGRDPRGRTISLAHATVVRGPHPQIRGGDDADQALWTSTADRPELAFDHAEILDTALDWLRRGVTEGPLGLALLPIEFGDDDIRSLHRALGIPARLVAPWRRRMERAGRIVTLPGMTARFRTVAD